MASLVTLADLREQAKERADMKNSAFISDASWNQFINSAWKGLYDILVSVAEDYYTEDATITVDGSSSYATLPGDFYKSVGIDYSLNGFNQPMDPYMFRDRLLYQNTTGITRYRLVGSRLKFNPTPAAQSMTLWYVPCANKLVDDADTLDGVNGWEDFVVVSAAIKALAKEESDTSELGAELTALKERIKNMAPNRDQGRSERVTDVTSYDFASRLFSNSIPPGSEP